MDPIRSKSLSWNEKLNTKNRYRAAAAIFFVSLFHFHEFIDIDTYQIHEEPIHIHFCFHINSIPSTQCDTLDTHLSIRETEKSKKHKTTMPRIAKQTNSLTLTHRQKKKETMISRKQNDDTDRCNVTSNYSQVVTTSSNTTIQ